MPSLYPLDCTACTQLLTLVTSIPADQCPGFLPGVMAANGIPATPQIVNFACKDALPILAKKNPTKTCVGMLKCSVNKPKAALRRTAVAKPAVASGAESETVAAPASAAMATVSAWFADNFEVAVAISVVCGLALLVLARLLFVKCCTKPLLQVEADDDFSASMPAVSYASPANAESAGHQSAEVEVDAGGAAAAAYAPPALPAAAVAAAEVPLLDAASEPAAGSA